MIGVGQNLFLRSRDEIQRCHAQMNENERERKRKRKRKRERERENKHETGNDQAAR